jgi:hypothetical protein
MFLLLDYFDLSTFVSWVQIPFRISIGLFTHFCAVFVTGAFLVSEDAISEMASCLPVTTEAGFQSQASPCGIFCRWGGMGVVFTPSSFFSPVSVFHLSATDSVQY